MFQRNLNQIWDQLRGRKTQYLFFLDRLRIKNLRGISDLTVNFNYPVTVIAGPNGCGKSTVLFSCSCAYRVPDAGLRDFFPSNIFPNLTTADLSITDHIEPSELEYAYTHSGQSLAMLWRRKKGWDKSFFGRPGATQPERQVYLRTLANLTSPSEVRSVLTISKKDFVKENITSDQIAFAHRILPYHYMNLTALKKHDKDLLFASRDDSSVSYSEFHMSAGERAILRLSRDISRYRNALILIDEIEAGLHPFTQQQLMLELQRLALRNDLQIMVTTHSPVVLDCVPVEGKVFLERVDDNVIVRPAIKTIIQKAYYGQSLDRLSILCEDEIGEAFVHGVLDYLNPKLGLLPEDIQVGKDTGKNEFPSHVKALGKFNRLLDFLFVLDADAKDCKDAIIQAAPSDQPVKPLFLPGDSIPEAWCWNVLSQRVSFYAGDFGISPEELGHKMNSLEMLYEAAADRPSAKEKNRFYQLSSSLNRQPEDLVRRIARKEAEKNEGDIVFFIQELETQIANWMARK